MWLKIRPHFQLKPTGMLLIAIKAYLKALTSGGEKTTPWWPTQTSLTLTAEPNYPKLEETAATKRHPSSPADVRREEVERLLLVHEGRERWSICGFDGENKWSFKKCCLPAYRAAEVHRASCATPVPLIMSQYVSFQKGKFLLITNQISIRIHNSIHLNHEISKFSLDSLMSAPPVNYSHPRNVVRSIEDVVVAVRGAVVLRRHFSFTV